MCKYIAIKVSKVGYGEQQTLSLSAGGVMDYLAHPGAPILFFLRNMEFSLGKLNPLSKSGNIALWVLIFLRYLVPHARYLVLYSKPERFWSSVSKILRRFCIEASKDSLLFLLVYG